MDIQVLHLLDGARQAKGLTVIIDVFRAFSLECYMYQANAGGVIPVGTVEDAFALQKANPSFILCGERNGIKVAGFAYGNSPSEFENIDLHNHVVIHTTSAGVQGIVNASSADEIITGSLVNAKAIASYIRQKNPETVSLVAMGWNAKKETEEDELCAAYISALLKGDGIEEIDRLADELRYTEGKKFFDPSKPEFPERDFALCTMVDRFNGVIRVLPHPVYGFVTEWKEVKNEF